MTSIFALVLLQSRTPIDPQIAQDWTAAVAANMKGATIHLRSNGRFSLDSVDVAGKHETIAGSYAVQPVPEGLAKGKMATAKQVLFTYDLPSLRRSGMPKAKVDELAKKGKQGAVGMMLYFFPDVPLLTDIMTSHFVPVKGKDAALKKLETWKPI